MATRTEKLTKAGRQMAKSTGRLANSVAHVVGDAAADIRNGVERAIARRVRRQKMARAAAAMKNVGKAAAVAAVASAAVVGAHHVVSRKKRR